MNSFKERIYEIYEAGLNDGDCQYFDTGDPQNFEEWFENWEGKKYFEELEEDAAKYEGLCEGI